MWILIWMIFFMYVSSQCSYFVFLLSPQLINFLRSQHQIWTTTIHLSPVVRNCNCDRSVEEHCSAMFKKENRSLRQFFTLDANWTHTSPWWLFSSAVKSVSSAISWSQVQVSSRYRFYKLTCFRSFVRRIVQFKYVISQPGYTFVCVHQLSFSEFLINLVWFNW